jgi:ketosteroid isomerase-like protein
VNRLTPALPIALLVLVAAAPPAEPVIAAERGFAAAAHAGDVAAAFRANMAGDAILFAPEPVSAKQAIGPDAKFPPSLAWWPAYAGISRSGDLGFTTGPFTIDEARKAQGWYFTVWRKQADGRWRWVLDHGTPTKARSDAGRDSRVAVAPAGRGGREAWVAVQAAEAKSAAALAVDAPTAYPAFLWDDGRLMRVGPQPAVGREAFTAAARSGPARLRTAPLGGGASKAGDLAFTYGTAAWEKEGSPVSGHYVRLWQRRNGGWKMLVDEVTPDPPAATPAPAQ